MNRRTKHATQRRQIRQGHKREHKSRAEVRETPEAGSGNCPEQSREEQVRQAQEKDAT